ncbi:hypothetical protein Glove_15g41 [Diversispora epigaea]|uniref:2OGFeDO JBP1/TET oxygenase domain-containing protein n=1 Tax=Diversispora epigaea TaxID=1348612 RepID=A0A397JPV9_9GLOM|nr:hypothetical protein Glove_15g41 [Diversispora epigaea]
MSSTISGKYQCFEIFKIFPTIAINFNIICQFHRDLKNHCNTLCVICLLKKFKAEELTFPKLKLAINAKQGQVMAFRSCLLIHGNLPVIMGARHSIVFYIHNTVIKQKRMFGSLFADYELDWGDNAHTTDNDGDEPSSSANAYRCRERKERITCTVQEITFL